MKHFITASSKLSRRFFSIHRWRWVITGFLIDYRWVNRGFSIRRWWLGQWLRLKCYPLIVLARAYCSDFN